MAPKNKNTREIALTFGSLSSDVDECSTAYSPCGQLCHNTPGSYSCECTQGHQLYNGTDCRVTGGFQCLKQNLAPALFSAVIIEKSDIDDSFEVLVLEMTLFFP